MKKKTLYYLAIAFLSATASFAQSQRTSCFELEQGSIDNSGYTLAQVQAGLYRGYFQDLNDLEVLKRAINEVGLKELNMLISQNVNPVPGDAYIDSLLRNNRIQPENPETVAFYFDPADEPVTNPVLGQILAEIFKRGSSVPTGGCFTFNINIATAEPSDALSLRFSVNKHDQWLFEISELEYSSKEEGCLDPIQGIIIIEDAGNNSAYLNVEAIAENSASEVQDVEVVPFNTVLQEVPMAGLSEETPEVIVAQDEPSFLSNFHKDYWCPYVHFVCKFLPEVLKEINIKNGGC